MYRSTRWCPTPEQLMILQGLYRQGLRTPKAFQIQKITTHLSLYGKIEGKNVFYWFQNHKARERQKLRKLMTMTNQLGHHHQNLQNPINPYSYSSSSILHRLPPSYISSGCLPQVGRVEDASPTVKDYILKVDTRNTSGHDSMMMDGYSGPVAPNFRMSKPLKTLDLFPTTTTGLKNYNAGNYYTKSKQEMHY